MPNLKGDDQAMQDMLTQSKIIAVIGHSDKPERSSYRIAQFLRKVGYKVYPVNPMVRQIDARPSYAALKEVPEAVDIVNVFRRSEYLSEIIDEAIAINAKTIWTQLGIYDEQSAQKALDAGLNLVMDACIQVEYLRLNIR